MAKIEQFPRKNEPDCKQDASDRAQQASADALQQVTTRRTAHEIFTNVERNGHDELRRSAKSLAFSGLAGGFGMGLTGLAVATVQSILGSSGAAEFISLLFYPLGFIAIIIGRAQLFTENTLYPVALILSEREHFFDTIRLWTIVFTANVFGAALFAALAIKTSSLTPQIASHLVQLGEHASQGPYAHVFWSGVIGGWIIALMAWIVSASHWTIGQVIMVWLLTVVVGMGHFAHCIASSGEILSAAFAGQISIASYLMWLLIATSGNVVGGVTFVTLLNFGQVTDEKDPAQDTGHEETNAA